MGAVISIETSSLQRNPSGGFRNLSSAEIAALANACAQLLERLGNLRERVELLKVVPWHAYGKPNIFEVRAVLAMHGEGTIKVEAKRTFAHYSLLGNPNPEWDLEKLPEKIASDMLREIHRAIQSRMFSLTQMRDRWAKYVPEDVKVS